MFSLVLSLPVLDHDYVFYFPPDVYVGTLNLIVSIPGPSIHTLKAIRLWWFLLFYVLVLNFCASVCALHECAFSYFS